MVKNQHPKLSLLCLASTLALSIGAVDAYAQCVSEPPEPPETEPETNARDNQSYDDGRCEHQAGLISAQDIYCGSRKSAYAPPKEYTFAQLWSGIRTVFGSPDETPLQSEPTIMLAKWSPTDEASEEAPAAQQASDEGRYYVQLAAMSSEDAARQYWSDLPRDLMAKTDGLKARFDPVMTVPSKRGLYAVQTGPFDGEDVARSWCSDLLQADIDCFIVHPDNS